MRHFETERFLADCDTARPENGWHTYDRWWGRVGRG